MKRIIVPLFLSFALIPLVASAVIDQALFEGAAVPFDESGIQPYGSAALVRFPDSKADDAAYILTVGHVGLGKENPGTKGFITCIPSMREFSLYGRDGKLAAAVIADELLYATRSANIISVDNYASDFALYRLSSHYTFARIEREFGVRPFEVSSAQLMVGESLAVISAYHEDQAFGEVVSIVDKVDASSVIQWRGVIRYKVNSGAHLKGGFSGAPLIDTKTRTVRAIHSAHEDEKTGLAQNIEAIFKIYDQFKCH